MLKVIFAVATAAACLLATEATAGGKVFAKITQTPTGFAPEGFAIGKGHIAYNGAVNGSIYKVDLRSGEGTQLTPVVDPDVAGGACSVLGLRVDPRTNYLFAAGCISGKAFVYDADTGALLMEYQLTEPFTGVINDLTITRDAVYFTDSYQPMLYRLPLLAGGNLPTDPNAATQIALPADIFTLNLETDFCCAANGIVASENGKTLVIGHSALAKLYRVETETGAVDEVLMNVPLQGFLDGLAMKGRDLYIMTPSDPDPQSKIQIVQLSNDMFTGLLGNDITDPALDDVASGAIFGNDLYVNNARYSNFPGGDTEYWITKLDLSKK